MKQPGPSQTIVELAAAFVVAGFAITGCGGKSGGPPHPDTVEADGAPAQGGSVSDARPEGTGSSGGDGTACQGGCSSGTGSSGAPGGSSGTIFTCTGCFDLNGDCQDGGADDKCGMTGGTCIDCQAFSQVCSSAGACSNGD